MRDNASFEWFASTDTAAAMKAYIRQHFGEMLGPYLTLLDQPGGLDALAALVRSGQLTDKDRG